jgi:hypothetical protein
MLLFMQSQHSIVVWQFPALFKAILVDLYHLHMQFLIC